MADLLRAESTRIELQTQIDSTKSSRDRNRLGQFATPPQLAQDIVSYALSILPANEKIRFLDPAVGTGSFFSALARSVPPTHIESAIGYEIDNAYAQVAEQLWGPANLSVVLGDFLKVKTLASASNFIICNPPYVRHHHIAPDWKRALRRKVAKTAGVNLNGLAGLYCYFLLATHEWMAPGAVAAWLIPSEFMDVNYGRELKSYLLNSVTLLRLHRFDPLDLQFDDALVASSVLWFTKLQPRTEHSIEFTFGGSIAAPALVKSIPSQSLKISAKWSKIFAPNSGRAAQDRLSDLFEIRRGIATGANDFFILDQRTIDEYEIPTDALAPILPGPRYLLDNVVRADQRGNPIIDKPLFLLSCTKSMDEIKLLYPGLWAYLQKGVRAGIHKRYLCKHRSPWYAQEIRKPTKFLCTYMGRQTSKTAKPFRFIFNESRATVPNVYLMLYPKPDLARMISLQPDLARLLWEKLNAIPAPDLVGESRVYGDGLHKLEPKELANVPLGNLRELVDLTPVVSIPRQIPMDMS